MVFEQFGLPQELIHQQPQVRFVPHFRKDLVFPVPFKILLHIVLKLATMSKVRKTLSAVVWREGKWFVAKTLEIELASQGKTKEKALKNLQEALDLLLEESGVKISPQSTLKEVELK